ncbi:MAG: hypothetical protein V1909_05710 [Candidatus Micrarchaeota archaeon]
MRAQLLFAVLILAGLAVASYNISEIREFDATSFSGYSEIGEIRQNTLLMYYSQGKDSLPKGYPEFASSSLDFMKKFGAAHNLSESAGPEALLLLPSSIEFCANSLWKMEGLASDGILLSKYNTYLARSVFERLVSTQAERLKGLAEGEPQTKKKLAYYQAAVGVSKYSETGVLAAELKATYESIKATYNADMEKADATFMEARELCETSISESEDWFGLSSYSGLKRCTAGLVEARKTYSANLEYEKLGELDDVLSRAEKTSSELQGGVAWFFVFSCIIFLLINWLVVNRVRRVLDDDYDASLGSEVLRWKRKP